jgi:hypothetical protein
LRRSALVGAAVAAALALPAVAAAALGISSTTNTSTTVTLNGFDQTAAGSFTMTISGAGTTGWHVTAWAAVPKDGSLSIGSLDVPSQPTASACTGPGCVKPSPSGLSFPLTLGTSSGTAVKIYDAAAHTGTGTDPVTVPYASAVPANTLAGPYTTTITLAIVSGP